MNPELNGYVPEELQKEIEIVQTTKEQNNVENQSEINNESMLEIKQEKLNSNQNNQEQLKKNEDKILFEKANNIVDQYEHEVNKLKINTCNTLENILKKVIESRNDSIELYSSYFENGEYYEIHGIRTNNGNLEYLKESRGMFYGSTFKEWTYLYLEPETLLNIIENFIDNDDEE